MRLCTECGTRTLGLSPFHRSLHSTHLSQTFSFPVKSIPTKPPAFDTQSVGRLFLFLWRPDQVSVTSSFGMAFWPYFGCVILQSSSSLAFIFLNHLFFTSRVGDIFLSFWMTLSHLSLQIRWADSTIRIRYRRVFPLFILLFSCL